MKPQTIGRALGIGIRVAGRIAGQRVAASANAASGAPAGNGPGRTVANSAEISRTAGQAAQGVTRGIGGFLRPFRRVGGIVWLEVTGVFFFLPVLVFSPKLWSLRASYLHGPDHRTFLVTAGIVVVFLYLGISSFWRAWHK